MAKELYLRETPHANGRSRVECLALFPIASPVLDPAGAPVTKPFDPLYIPEIIKKKVSSAHIAELNAGTMGFHYWKTWLKAGEAVADFVADIRVDHVLVAAYDLQKKRDDSAETAGTTGEVNHYNIDR